MLDTTKEFAHSSATTVALVAGHAVGATGLLIYASACGVFAPVPAIGAIWLLLLARGLLRPTQRLPQLLRITHAFGLLAGILVAVYGIFFMQSVPGAGYGPDGGLFRLLTVLVGVVAILVSAATLYASRPPLSDVRGRSASPIGRTMAARRPGAADAPDGVRDAR
jgi:hypothetical protein